MDQGFLDRLTAAAPGIDRYIAAPDAVTPPAEDQSGNPLATQPENDPQQNNPSNMSTDEARAEQDEIDERLSAGREKAEEASDDADEGNQSVGSTQLNPEASSSDDKPEEREKAAAPAKKAGKKTPGA